MSKNVLENWETKQETGRPGSSRIHRPNTREAKFCPQRQMCVDALASVGNRQRAKWGLALFHNQNSI